MYNMSCVCQRDGHKINARVAQLVEHNLAKVGAAGSSPVSRFHIKKEWLQKGVALFYFEPRRGSKFEVSAAASVVAKRCPPDTSYVSRSNIKKSDSKRNRSFFASSPAAARSSRSRLSPRSTILLEVFRHHFLQLLLSLLLMHRHQ